DPTKGAWPSSSVANLRRNQPTILDEEGFQQAIYRPFMRANVYFDRSGHLNHRISQIPKLWPTTAHRNLAIWVTGAGSGKPFSPMVVSMIPDMHLGGASTGGQVFAR